MAHDGCRPGAEIRCRGTQQSLIGSAVGLLTVFERRRWFAPGAWNFRHRMPRWEPNMDAGEARCATR